LEIAPDDGGSYMPKIPLIIVETIVLFAMSLTGIVQGVYLIRTPDPYALYDKVGPGGSLILISSLLIITLIVHLIRHRKDLSEEKREPTKEGTTRRLVRASVTIAIFIVLIDIIGFLPASMIFFFLILRFLGIQSWLRNAVLSIVFSLSIYLIFVQALNMELPGGLLLEFVRPD
jgi:putative tricarboxylic transport membrane protein